MIQMLLMLHSSLAEQVTCIGQFLKRPRKDSANIMPLGGTSQTLGMLRIVSEIYDKRDNFVDCAVFLSLGEGCFA